MSHTYNWAERMPDTKTTDLSTLENFANLRYAHSIDRERSLGDLKVIQHEDDVMLEGIGADPLTFTNWSFSQLATKVGAPASYLKTLEPNLLMECLNYGIQERPNATIRTVENQASVPGSTGVLRAMNGSRYERVYDNLIIPAIGEMIGDEGGLALKFARVSDRRTTALLVHDNMGVKLTRPDGRTEELHRGIQIANSEVGAMAFAIKLLWFRYACENGMIFGGKTVGSTKIRHVGENAGFSILDSIRKFRGSKIWGNWAEEKEVMQLAVSNEVAKSDKQAEVWLARRGVPKRLAVKVVERAVVEEGSAATAWDLANGLTAIARESKHADQKEEMETLAGDLLLKHAKEV